MPLNLRPLEIILRPNSSLALLASILLFSLESLALNPMNFDTEFEEKLASKSLISSTYFYTSEKKIKIDQKSTLIDLKTTFLKSGYRERSSEQPLVENDFSTLISTQCQPLLKSAEPLPIDNCLIWIDKDQNSWVLSIYQNTVNRIYNITAAKNSFEFPFEPLLLAQYKDGSPVLQDEKKLANIPLACLNAAIAIEDNDFLQHSGVSYTGVFRALVKNVLSLRKAQGGSTITQQLVKNYFLTAEKTYSRKIKEFYMALRLESEWTKDEILQTYLNIIYMGQSGAYQVRGFPAASQVYFAKNISDLKLHECALLAAIINNPGQNNPWAKPENAKKRRNLVLKKMQDLQLITTSESEKAQKESLPPVTETKSLITAPYFFEAALKQLSDLGISADNKHIFTSIDISMQKAAQVALKTGIDELIQSKKALKEKASKGQNIQGALISADNQTGLVKVFVGGESYLTTQFNRALNSRRQIGSLIKPFVYLAGLNTSTFQPSSNLEDKKWVWHYDNKTWAPDNYDKKFRGTVPYYYALKESLNVPTAQVAEKIGIDTFIDIAHKAGLESTIEKIPSSCLGTSEHSPLEVVQAYSTLANSGRYQKLSFIHKVTDLKKVLIYEHVIKSEQVLNEKTTRQLIEMLKYGPINGTSKYLNQIGLSQGIAGKTGTTSQSKDAWFTGFNTQMTTTVWLGYDNNTTTQLTGASGAVPIWANFVKQSYPIPNGNDFPVPMGLKYQEFRFPDINETVNLLVE